MNPWEVTISARLKRLKDEHATLVSQADSLGKKARQWFRRASTREALLTAAQVKAGAARVLEPQIRVLEEALAPKRIITSPPNRIPMPKGLDYTQATADAAQAQVAVYDAGEAGKRAVDNLRYAEEREREWEESLKRAREQDPDNDRS